MSRKLQTAILSEEITTLLSQLDDKSSNIERFRIKHIDLVAKSSKLGYAFIKELENIALELTRLAVNQKTKTR